MTGRLQKWLGANTNVPLLIFQVVVFVGIVLCALLYAMRDNGPLCIDNPAGAVREWIGR